MFLELRRTDQSDIFNQPAVMDVQSCGDRLVSGIEQIDVGCTGPHRFHIDFTEEIEFSAFHSFCSRLQEHLFKGRLEFPARIGIVTGHSLGPVSPKPDFSELGQ